MGKSRPGLLHDQVDVQVQGIGQLAPATQPRGQVGCRLGLHVQIDITAAAVVVHPRAEQPDARVFAHVVVDALPYGLGLIGRQSHGVFVNGLPSGH